MTNDRAVRQTAITLASEISATEMKGMKEVLKRSQLKGDHLEIGTAAGGTLKEIINCYAEPRPNFFVIDPMTYFPQQFEKICQNLLSANIEPTNVTFWKGTSAKFLKSYATRDKTFDFIFIDGNHAHYFVTLDLAWCDRLTVGGIVCLHDNSSTHPGVGWAVERFLSRNPNFDKVGQFESLTILRKKTRGRRTVTTVDLATAYFFQQKRTVRRSLTKRLGLSLR